jgi:hypothetical protein
MPQTWWRSNGLVEALGPGRRLIHNLPKSRDGFFYIDSIKYDFYRYFLIEAELPGGAGYAAGNPNNDFTEITSDTIDRTFCMHPNSMILEQKHY